MSEYWRGHSPVSQPGDDALAAIAALPSDIPSLHHAANQLVLHYRAQVQHVPAERRPEIHTRYADAMLTRIFTRGPGATLSADRGPRDKTVGCCRDSALLLVALARSKGYAARVRVGFGAYFADGYMLDHTVAEIWDSAAERWRLVDADVPADWGREVQGTAPQAWRQVRTEGAVDDKSRHTGFVGAPPDLCGEVFIAHNVVHDLAALAKTELLLWEEWGARVDYTDTLPAADADVLDEVAAVTARRDVKSEAVEMLMRREDMAVPETVMLFDPYAATAPPKPVDVSRALKAQVWTF